MTDTTEVLAARKALLEKWADVMEELVLQMTQQAREKGYDPNWFYPRKIITGRDSIRIHWSLRPGIEHAMKLATSGMPLDEAVRLGVAADQKSLEDLLLNDTLWEQEG